MERRAFCQALVGMCLSAIGLSNRKWRWASTRHGQHTLTTRIGPGGDYPTIATWEDDLDKCFVRNCIVTDCVGITIDHLEIPSTAMTFNNSVVLKTK